MLNSDDEHQLKPIDHEKLQKSVTSYICFERKLNFLQKKNTRRDRFTRFP
jgi:hypothetical protein